ncbi:MULTISPECIES: hybrid sensor histidine kinase/response regulator [unclassified Chelatococcus]|uniref:hybrid sensor histidine kinase/response regulator n=1 Tax=unclassified Chelatococcus TaxID=2638111 RepID=UPI001BCB99DD|nr:MULTISPECIES: hybrid sensor histidine kinase/response regulator [unclassified Chelatococcus]CAH1660542.1 Signal transduction histidine kinase CheA [Hyphomicrobiales bacterium]MBS7741127.1 hybrid sensor histidine kinase/response regulator [Chelatococcus sp. HY11]MBX3545313.1 hybrid sensor histidine kinase/response regulator [Chelatococcus sp.]MCO5077946.1 hybrid sensor histidine kinase/response regulator [Chelatococcus sp.]CAH1683394.1 Signal transduction histidine kinase CheA [Hyphomicrobia
MDELLREFLTETNEHLDVVDVELVRFERDPNDIDVLRNVFRLVHTIKGTCGFLGLPRLEAIAHAAESLLGRFRDGKVEVQPEDVSLILASIDRIKHIVAELDRTAAEPPGTDRDIIDQLEGSLKRPQQDERVARVASVVEASPDGDRGSLRQPTIRVTVDVLEHLMTMVSELVLTRNQLLDLARRQDDPALMVPLQRLSHVTVELQEGVMKARMQPIGTVWQKMPRILRDLAVDLGKSIDLKLRGPETELDRQVLEFVKDPLTQLVRNAADHGIEVPAARIKAGKPERGTITLSAFHDSGSITVEVSDDGRGLDYQRIRHIAIERGLITEAEADRLGDAAVARFIFHPGFSTAQAVTSVSGRGVGMDIVKTNIDLIGGSVEVRSEAGRGTTFVVKLPLTLAIVATLIVGAAGQRFAIPQMSIMELVRVRPGQGDAAVEKLNDALVFRQRNELIPVIPFATLLGLTAKDQATAHDGFIVVIQIGRQRFGLLVDTVLHTEEIVVKPLNKRLRSLRCFSGSTILGDGSIILIVEPGGLVRMFEDYAESAVPTIEARPEPEPQKIEEEMDGPVSLLVFRAGSDMPKAVPLSLVTRLEEIDAARIEQAGGRLLLQYRGHLMPLVFADPAMSLQKEGRQAMVVFSDGDRWMGLIVDEILDIVEDALTVELVADRPELVGSAIVRGRATEILNVAHFLPLGHGAWLQREVAPQTVTRTVLLVDDSEFFRSMLAPLLRASGYRVLVADGVEGALATLALPRLVDVVVTDLEMPDRSGFDLIESLRAEPRFAGLPVIALSSYVSPPIVERARKLGVVNFVAKFDRSGLVEALSAVLNARSRGVAA